MLRARIGGLIFEGNPTTREGLFTIGESGLSGWFEKPPTRSFGGGDRPTADGGFDVPILTSARPITLNGHILASSQAELEHMKNQLTGLLPGGGAGKLVVDSDLGSTWANVRVVGARPGANKGEETDYTLQLVANDPRRYGETHTTEPGVSVSAYHYGNATATPVIYVTGVMPSGYTINGPGGRTFVVSQGLAAGQTHEIRMRSGWLYRNGVWQRTGVARAQTWGIPPGKQVLMTLSPVSGSGSMTVLPTDTYM